MKNNRTELVFILDKSGSMAGLEADTIGGFNSMIEKQKRVEGEAFVSTVLFDTHASVVHDRVPLADVQPMTCEDYLAGGCTALLDTLGDSIRHIGNIHKYARTEDVPGQTIFVITTDGQENASHRYSAEEVRHLIERQKTRFGWEFLFLGANINALETASRYGIDNDHAVRYCSDSQGTALNYEVLSDAVEQMRLTDSTLKPSWKRRIEEDYFGRQKW